jgi:hypothetical protein
MHVAKYLTENSSFIANRKIKPMRGAKNYWGKIHHGWNQSIYKMNKL